MCKTSALKASSAVDKLQPVIKSFFQSHFALQF